MTETKTKKILIPVLVFVIIILAWELAVRTAGIPMYVMPSPWEIVKAAFEERQILLTHGLITLEETVIGLAIAAILGMFIAIAMDCFNMFRLATYPILVISQTIPVIVLAPIFMIYFGFGMMPKVLVVVLMCFFPIAVSFADGMRQVDINQINLVRQFGAGRIKSYTLVKIPAALPSLFSGLKVAATYSITGAVVGEWLSSTSGLGYYMLRVKNAYMLDRVFACVLVVVLLSLLMNACVKLIERLAVKP